jgi:hypothetical protein
VSGHPLTHTMGAIFRTGHPPDMEKWLGRGWEPERTYNTPRLDISRSIKSRPKGGGTWAGQTAERGDGGSADSRSVQPGLATASLRSHYQQRHDSRGFPGPSSLGEGEAHRGFDPSRGVYGREARHGLTYSSKKAPPLPPQSSSFSTQPVMMGGKVLAGGTRPSVPAHHLKGYQNPDAAIVRDGEGTAMTTALTLNKRRAK